MYCKFVMNMRIVQIPCMRVGSHPHYISQSTRISIDSTAVIEDSVTQSGALHYTYRELVLRVTEIAETFQQFLSNVPSHIGVYCENSFELVISLLAILSTEHSYVPLTSLNLCLITELHTQIVLVSTDLLEQFLLAASSPQLLSIDTQLSHCGIVICLYSRCSSSCVSYSQHSLSLYDLFYRSLESGFIRVSDTSLPFSHTVAYVLQTSGTTGRPKTISVPHSCLIPNIIDLSGMFSLSPLDTCLLSAPPTFDPSLVQILTSLVRGCTLIVAPCSPSVLSRHSITVLQCTPSLFRTLPLPLCRRLLGPASCLRVLAFGGESCPSLSTVRRWRHPGNRTDIYNVYGITEVSCWSTCHKVDLDNQTADWNDTVPIGQALSGTRVELRSGEIWVGGASRRCEVEGDGAEEMRNTGDTGVRSSDGEILCMGRRDDQLKRLGHRVSLLTIETALSRLTGVNTCVVRRETGRDAVTAYLCVDNACSDWMELRREIQNNIPSKLRPDIIRKLSCLPLTPHGKIDTPSLSPLSHQPLPASLSSAVREFFGTELSLLSLAPSHSPLRELGVDSFELVGIAHRLQDLITDYREININEVFGSFYDFLSSHPTDLLSDTISQRIDEFSQSIPPSKRIRTDSTYHTQSSQVLSCPLIYLRRGAISCSPRSIPSPLLPPSAPLSLSLSWCHETGRCVDSSPLLCYDPTSLNLTVYAGSHSRLFSAVRASDGVCLWSRDLDDRVESSAALSHCGFYLAVGTYGGWVWVLEREGGGVHWRCSTGSEPVKSSPCVDPSTGLAWVGTHSQTLVALNVAERRLVFSVNTESGSCYSSPVADPVEGAVYVGTHGGDLLCVSGSRGEVEWRRGLKSAVFSSPCLLPDHSVAVGTVARCLYCVRRDSTVKWVFDTNSPVFSSPCVSHSARGESLIMGTYDGRIISLDTAGRMEWETELESDMFSIPFALPCNPSINEFGIIAVALNNGTIILLDTSGVQLCSYKLPKEVYSSPVVAGSQLFVGCRDNKLYCLNIIK